MIEAIREKIQSENFELSVHALTRSIQRGILLEEICESILDGEIIETYPDDRYGPSCLIMGFTTLGRPIHSQCSYPVRPLLKVITVYEPSIEKWEPNFKTRK
jgi:hypothetical protein